MLPPITIIGQRLKELRLNSDNTMDEEAAQLNQTFKLKITKSMMSRWESGQSQPSSVFLSAYAKYHNIDLNYIVGLTDVSSPLSQKLEIISDDNTFLPNSESSRPLCRYSEILKEAPEIEDVVESYASLDKEDRGVIRGEIKGMLRAEKYSYSSRIKDDTAIG